LNDGIKWSFGKQMTKGTQLRLYNITPTAALNYGSENWILKQRGTQRLEAAQKEF
jgi:hypothetical protein